MQFPKTFLNELIANFLFQYNTDVAPAPPLHPKILNTPLYLRWIFTLPVS